MTELECLEAQIKDVVHEKMAKYLGGPFTRQMRMEIGSVAAPDIASIVQQIVGYSTVVDVLTEDGERLTGTQANLGFRISWQDYTQRYYVEVWVC